MFELRAIYFLVARLGASEQVKVLTDSAAAVDYLERWQRGKRRMPPGYGKPGARLRVLDRLALEVTARPGLRFEHVRGHAGHLLNEAADSLARLAARSPEEAGRRSPDLVRAFLTSWHGDSCP